MEFTREFVAVVSKNDKDLGSQVVGAIGCDSSVSLTFSELTIHVPWGEIVNWIHELAQQTEENA